MVRCIRLQQWFESPLCNAHCGPLPHGSLPPTCDFRASQSSLSYLIYSTSNLPGTCFQHTNPCKSRNLLLNNSVVQTSTNERSGFPLKWMYEGSRWSPDFGSNCIIKLTQHFLEFRLPWLPRISYLCTIHKAQHRGFVLPHALRKKGQRIKYRLKFTLLWTIYYFNCYSIFFQLTFHY